MRWGSGNPGGGGQGVGDGGQLCLQVYVYDSFCLDLPFVYLLTRVLSLCPSLC